MITTALRLPAPDVEALIQGRTIVAISPIFLNPGRLFALYPSDASTISLPVERYYRSTFLSIAQKSFTDLNLETVSIKAWARCEFCRGVKDPQALAAISRLTVWTEEALQEILSQKSNIILAYLRVYQLLQPIEVPTNRQSPFVPLQQPLPTTESLQVIGDQAFSQRRRQLENLEAPLHPELEELQSKISQLNDEKTVSLIEKINQFLGWKTNQTANQSDPNIDWISTINDLGTATIGGNFERGDAFEKIVRKSLRFLGFDVDPNAKGGAGGMDLYCKSPYPLVGECKAGKSIGNMAVKELVELGGTHLGADHFLGAIKLVIGPGEPTKPLLKAANEWKVSIINPMTLQKLVKLQAKYPGSVNLIELKPYLEAGQIDSRIDEYIEKVLKDIRLRSHIVEAVKQLGESGSGHLTAEIRVHYNAVFVKEQSSKLEELRLVHELLLELSSPLTGYLGRKKGNDWDSDRFYFLRDLPY